MKSGLPSSVNVRSVRDTPKVNWVWFLIGDVNDDF